MSFYQLHPERDFDDTSFIIQSLIHYYIPRIRRIGGCYGFTSKPPAARNGVNAITQKPQDGLFSNLVYTLVVIVSWPDKLFKVVGQRSRSQRQKMMWFFRHFLIFISYHIFLLNQVEGAIAIPLSNSAPLPLFCPSVCPSVCPSIGLLTTFSGFCTFADKSLGRNGIELEMQMFPDDIPLANIDADGYCCHFMRSSVRPTIHGLGFVYCIQSAWKKWPTIWHADVSRWLTLSIHGCLWILLLVCLSVHLSVCSFTAFSGGCAFADKSLGTNGIKFDLLMYLLV